MDFLKLLADLFGTLQKNHYNTDPFLAQHSQPIAMQGGNRYQT